MIVCAVVGPLQAAQTQPKSSTIKFVVGSQPPSCDQTLQACDKAVNALQSENKKLYDLMDLKDKEVATDNAEVIRLRAVNDAWYRSNPWIVGLIGVALGGIAYGFINRR